MGNVSPFNPECDHHSLLRVVVVEDHPWVRRGLLAMIAAEAEFMVCGKADNAQCAMKLVAARKPDLAIIDILLKGDMDGIELTKALKASHPHLQILVLSYHFDPEYKIKALASGASAYLCKIATSIHLFNVLRGIANKRQ